MRKKAYMQRAEALGSVAELWIVSENAADAETWFARLWPEIGRFESRFSRFKPDSELSLFNLRAGQKTRISDEFKKILEAAIRHYELSKSLFNPFILPGLQRAGYGFSLTGTKEGMIDYTQRKIADFSLLEIGNDWAKIPPDSALDLGGLGKGYLADRLSEIFSGKIGDYCLSLGGDMKVSGQNGSKPWVIDIQSAESPDKNIAGFSGPQDGFGLATSGLTRHKAGRAQAHLIDPKTGQPVLGPQGICTVAAAEAVTADVMASCILIGGPGLARQLIEQKTINAVLLQSADGLLKLGEGFSPFYA